MRWVLRLRDYLCVINFPLLADEVPWMVVQFMGFDIDFSAVVLVCSYFHLLNNLFPNQALVALFRRIFKFRTPCQRIL